jgi:hypothetical protein
LEDPTTMKAKKLFDPSHVKGIYSQTFDVKGTSRIKNYGY